MIRGIFTWVMIFGFGWIIYMGPLALMCIVSMPDRVVHRTQKDG